MHKSNCFRRAAILFLSVALAVMSGCSFVQSPPPAAPTDEPITVHTSYRNEYESCRCFRSLTPRMQSMYDALYGAVKECDTDRQITIKTSAGESTYTGCKVQLPAAMMSGDEAHLLFTALVTDNPQFFFIGNTYSYEGYRLDDTEYYDVFCLTFTMDSAARKAASAVLDQAANGLLSRIPAGASAYDKELFLHDELTKVITYDHDTSVSPDPMKQRPSAFTAYGALAEGSAVCEGYSRAMQLLLRRVGIPCSLVSGTADGNSHMWNLVEIDGRGYHLDVTWDDAEDYLHHTFFNLTTEEILLSHTIDRDNIAVDTCSSTAANFYRHEGWYLDTFDCSLIAEAIAQQVITGAESADLRFSEDTFANAQFFLSNAARAKQYIEPFLNGESMWNYVFQVNDAYGTITLYKMS